MNALDGGVSTVVGGERVRLQHAVRTTGAYGGAYAYGVEERLVETRFGCGYVDNPFTCISQLLGKVVAGLIEVSLEVMIHAVHTRRDRSRRAKCTVVVICKVEEVFVLTIEPYPPGPSVSVIYDTPRGQSGAQIEVEPRFQTFASLPVPVY